MARSKRRDSRLVTPDELVRIIPEMRARYQTGSYTVDRLADHFRVATNTVMNALRPQDYFECDQARKNRILAVYDGIAAEWRSGDYTVKQIAERWGRKPNRITNIISDMGMSSHDLQYRNARIADRHEAGESRESIAKRYGIRENYVLRILNAFPNTLRICIRCGGSFMPTDVKHVNCTQRCAEWASRVTKTCWICGTVFETTARRQEVCSTTCTGNVRRVRSVEQSLNVRRLRRLGHTYKEVSLLSGVSPGSVKTMLKKNRRGEYLKAIETMRRHRGQEWLSGLAKLEVKRARDVLKAEGLDHYYGGKVEGTMPDESEEG